MFPTSRGLLPEGRCSCLYSCTNDWYSALQPSTSEPLIQPVSSKPSNNMLNKMTGQKQLMPCPTTELAATEKSTELTIFVKTAEHRTGTHSWDKSFWIIEHRVADRNLSSWMEGNLELFGVTNSCHCSTGGKALFFLVFWKIQYAKRASSPNV